MELVSVIVPVYNVERYLKRCVESILNQTYTNIEVLLIDDGSKDNSGAICDEYTRKDIRVKVVHKENGGVSVARNLAIDMAKGEYIFFVDSDDWISEKSIEKHVELIKNNSCQLTFSMWEARGFLKQYFTLDNDKINLYDKERNTGDFLLKFRTPWNKLFVSKIIKENNIRFPIGVKYGEDTFFVWEYLKYCKEICMCKDVLYLYNTLNLRSATRQNYSDRAKWLLSDLEILVELVEMYGMKDHYKYQVVEEFLTFGIEAGYLDVLRDNKKDKKKIIEHIEKLLQMFEPQISYCEEKGKASGQELKKTFYTRDANVVYKNNIPRLRRKLNIEQIKDVLRCLAKVFVKPYLEKYRDGLIK